MFFVKICTKYKQRTLIINSFNKSKSSIEEEFDLNYFLKIFIYLEQNNQRVNLEEIKRHLKVNYVFLTRVVTRYKSFFILSAVDNDTSKPNNITVEINKEGKDFFFNHIEEKMKIL